MFAHCATGQPAGREPVAGNEEDRRLAALRSLVQPALPALARRDPALRVEVEERFAPARLGEPIDQPDRLEAVTAGMAVRDLRQGAAPVRHCGTKEGARARWAASALSDSQCTGLTRAS